jgi:hypothetical protein
MIHKHVVLTWDVEHPIGPDRPENLPDSIELFRRAQMHVIAGVHHERGALRQRVDPSHVLLERADHVLVGGLVKADMTI